MEIMKSDALSVRVTKCIKVQCSLLFTLLVCDFEVA